MNELPGHSGSVRSLAFLGSRLLSGSTDGTVRLWDFDSLISHDANSATGGTASDSYADSPVGLDGLDGSSDELGPVGGHGDGDDGGDDDDDDADDYDLNYTEHDAEYRAV